MINGGRNRREAEDGLGGGGGGVGNGDTGDRVQQIGGEQETSALLGKESQSYEEDS